VLTPEGLEVRSFRTTMLPWSAITVVTTYRQPGDGVGVRVLTAVGPVDLPAPTTDRSLPDPRFARKADFIQRCWEAHRGVAWTAPPPPRDAWPPPSAGHAGPV
jgi:hypothetical protein